MPSLLPASEQTPLNAEQHRNVQQLLVDLSSEQLAWLGGYLTTQIPNNIAIPSVAKDNSIAITILVGSQTSNSEALAEQTQELAGRCGLKTIIKPMGDYSLSQLKNERYILVIVSTYGEGEPPDNAKELYQYLFSKRAPALKQTQFSVLALGDSSYEFFCKTGADFDQRLEELGATRIYPRVDCDVDYEASAEAWMEAVINQLSSLAGAKDQPSQLASPSSVVAITPQYSRKNPFPASLLENTVLNGRGSVKETHHIELSLENSGLTYEPGDALGVYPTNAPDVVAALLQALHFNGSEPVSISGSDQASIEGTQCSIEDALLHRFEITTLTRPMLQKYAALAKLEPLDNLLADAHKQELNTYLHGREIIDLVEDFPVAQLSPQAFIDCLRNQTPRLYSIASSLKQHPGEVHLTLGALRYETHGRHRKGVASTFLADRIDENTAIPVYIHKNNNFKLPADPNTPIIMIGPGTGIAPFRAFIQEREAAGARGKNWLFFGDQHFTTDFLYQSEWLRYLKKGVLTHLHVAFSRDQEQKVYVQQRMLEQAKELYAWLQEGAYVYVCGDEKRMAHDVHAALANIVAVESGTGNGEDYLAKLQKEKRYQRDVY